VKILTGLSEMINYQLVKLNRNFLLVFFDVRLLYLSAIGVFIMQLSGCAAVPPIIAAQSAVGVANMVALPTLESSENTNKAPIETTTVHTLNPWEDPNNPLYQRTIYFDNDAIEIKPEYLSIIAHHARYLGTHPAQKVTLEGYSEPRGTRSYNLSLGEQRADAVRRLLFAEGVLPNQVTMLSYGEERLIDPRSNHRVIINY
jgi:peptidoglycan-associated lipoprotein